VVWWLLVGVPGCVLSGSFQKQQCLSSFAILCTTLRSSRRFWVGVRQMRESCH
jgi:hypothetical protein